MNQHENPFTERLSGFMVRSITRFSTGSGPSFLIEGEHNRMTLCTRGGSAASDYFVDLSMDHPLTPKSFFPIPMNIVLDRFGVIIAAVVSPSAYFIDRNPVALTKGGFAEVTDVEEYHERAGNDFPYVTLTERAFDVREHGPRLRYYRREDVTIR